MKNGLLTNEEIRTLGLKTLMRELGPDGTVRFLRLMVSRSGDYTKQRMLLFEDGDLDDLLCDLSKRTRKHI